MRRYVEVRVDGQLHRLELRLADELAFGVRRRHGCVGNITPAGCRRVEAVEPVAFATQEGHEAGAGCVEVEPARGRVAVVVEGVHDVRRHGDEGSGRCTHGVAVGPDPELQLALDDIEGVDVLVVDMQVGSALPCVIARPRDIEQWVITERAHRALGQLRHRRSVLDREHDGPGLIVGHG